MTRFDRYMLSQLMALFGFFSLVLVMVYWVNRAVALFDQLIADGQSAAVFLEFTALTLPNVIRIVLPISAFVAAIYVTNRMSSESELVVMRASGTGSFRLARPVLIFGLIVATLLMLLTHVLVPISNRAMGERQDEIAQNITARFIDEGRFLHPSSGVTFYIAEISPSGELQDIFLSDRRDPRRSTIYSARRALLVREDTGPKLLMFDGLAQTLHTPDERLSTTRFKDFAYDLTALVMGQRSRGLDPRSLSTATLLSMNPEIIAATGTSPARFLAGAHDRFAQPLLAVVTALVGFACLLLGGFSRFGVWKQVFLAVFLLIAIRTFDNAMADIARADVRYWPALYMPALVGLILAGIILWMADTPSLFTRRGRSAPEEEVPA